MEPTKAEAEVPVTSSDSESTQSWGEFNAQDGHQVPTSRPNSVSSWRPLQQTLNQMALKKLQEELKLKLQKARRLKKELKRRSSRIAKARRLLLCEG